MHSGLFQECGDKHKQGDTIMRFTAILSLAAAALLVGLASPAVAQQEPDLSRLSPDAWENSYSRASYARPASMAFAHGRSHRHHHQVAHHVNRYSS